MRLLVISQAAENRRVVNLSRVIEITHDDFGRIHFDFGGNFTTVVVHPKQVRRAFDAVILAAAAGDLVGAVDLVPFQFASIG